MNENNFTSGGKGCAVTGNLPLQLFLKTIQLRAVPSAWVVPFFMAFFLSGNLSAEGTKQLQPTNLSRNKAPLYINASSDSGGDRTNFAGWAVADEKSRLYINIQDPANESLYIGLGDWIGLGNDNAIRYRVMTPDGLTVVKEMTMTSPNIANYNEAVNGPSTLMAGGYNESAGGGPHIVTSADFLTAGGGIGDYYIEFSEVDDDDNLIVGDNDGFSIGLYDFTVGTGTNAIDGRVWSFRWEFRQQGPEGADDYEFDGAFFVCAEDLGTAAPNDGFVTYIDFISPAVLADEMGFIPVNFNVIFNNEGPGLGATPGEKRKSQIGCAQLGEPTHKAFLNDPGNLCVEAEEGMISDIATLEQCGPDNYCWVVSADKFGGEFEILINLNGVPDFQTGTADVLLTYSVAAGEEGTNICIPWDGLDGNGNEVGLIVDLTNVTINYLEGIFHFPIFDAEANTDGFTVTYIRPIPATPLMIKWDDSEVNGGACDQTCGTPLGLCPKNISLDSDLNPSNCVATELKGCDPNDASCTRCWPRSYGDRATLNTYWTIYSQEVTPQKNEANFYECSIDGNTVLCDAGETTTISANIVTTGNPDPFTWQWEDAAGNMTNGTGTMSSDIPSFVGLTNSDVGTYTLTLNFGLACTITCSVTLIEGTVPEAPVIIGGTADRDLCATPADPLLIEVPPTTDVIYTETFEQNGAGATAVCDDDEEIALCTSYTPPTNGQWALTGTSYNLGNENSQTDYLVVSNGQLEGTDIDGTLCFETSMIDISAIPAVAFSLDLSEDPEDDLESSDNVAISYSIDGAAFVNTATIADDFAAQTISETGLVGNTLQLQVCFTNNSNAEHYFLDNVTVTNAPIYYFYDVDPTTAGATPVAIGSSYTPTIASGTTASIWVTCFNGQCESEATSILFNNDCCVLAVTCADPIPNTDLVCPSELPATPTSFNDFAVKGDEAAFEALHAAPDFVIDDNFCGEIVITSADTDNGGTGCANSPLIVTRTYTILDDEDGSGDQNGTEATATCSETFTFIDNVAPTFTNCVNGGIADPIERDCNSPATEEIVLLAVGAPMDNCALGTATATATMTSTDTVACVVTEVWTATVNDACGTAGTCTVTYTYIVDNTNPTFTLCEDNNPSNDTISLGCNIATTPTEADAIAAVGAPIDLCGFGTNMATATMTSMTDGCLTTEAWTVSITDACGNMGSCIVYYQYLTDTEAPAFANCSDGMVANDTLALGCNPTAPIDTDAIALAGSINESCELGTNTPTASRTNVITVSCLTTEEWTVRVTDVCGNEGSCVVYFTYTIDHDAPVLPCQTTTTLALSGDGSEVHWSAFVTNITEACGLNSVQVRRQDMAHCEGDDSSVFAANVPFYCCDIGNTVTVEVQATDLCGNVNSCNVFVMVEDNITPMIDCPADKSIDCDSLHLLSTYDKVTLDADGVEDDPAPSGVLTYVINLDNPADPDTIFLGYFDESSIWEDCGGARIYIWDTGSVNECGNSVDANGDLLPLQRHYVAVDAAGNASATCIQNITVSNMTPFNPITDISWPAHYMNPGPNCGDPIHPDSFSTGFQRPVVNASDNCENLAVGYSDSPHLYPTNATSDYCYKILRSWNVLDWCEDTSYTHNQVIMVVDPGPVFTSACPDTIMVVSGNNLIINKTADNLCSGTLANITYTVDLNNDGSIENNGATGSIDEATGGTLYPEGTHKITFTAEGCSQNSTCEVIVIVTPMAPPNAMSNVSGYISNESNLMVENVMISPASGMDVAMTDANGAFNLNLPSSENYELMPQKDGDYLNGVSTYDIVLLSKHILQLQTLDSPYKIIAGDVNKSGSITTLDLVELRKVILYINDEFPNNSSWRFVDADYVFPTATNPFEEIFPESYAINGLSGDMEDLDFIAIKIGDVNGTATTNGLTEDAEGRDFEGTLKLEIDDAELRTAETHSIAVTAKDFNALLGYQFTMQFDHLEIIDVVPGELSGMTAANFGTQYMEDGILTTSWNANEAVSIEDGATLFSVTVKAEAYVKLSEALRLTSRYTFAEAYAENAGAVERLGLGIAFKHYKSTTFLPVFELHQNKPNPFKDETVIGFDLPNGGTATLTIYDLSGRMLKQIEDRYPKGYSEVSIQRNDLPASGVLYYELSTGKNTALRKMTIVE